MTSPTAKKPGFHFLLAASVTRRALAGSQFDEGFNGSAGAFGGAGFDDLSHQHEEGDDAGLLVAADLEIGRAKGSQDGQGDQFVGRQQDRGANR